ncbi:MAG: hypothetical protein GEV06_27055 [Luteitalea sp.]|nr:hypothetical protein [Luteitalea sp.]
MTRKAGVFVMTAIVLWPSRPADAGPITFLTALPVPQSQVVIRGQYFLIRATDDPTPAERELTVQDLPLAIAGGVTSRLAIFGVVPIVNKSMELSTPCPFCAYGIKKQLGTVRPKPPSP